MWSVACLSTVRSISAFSRRHRIHPHSVSSCLRYIYALHVRTSSFPIFLGQHVHSLSSSSSSSSSSPSPSPPTAKRRIHRIGNHKPYPGGNRLRSRGITDAHLIRMQAPYRSIILQRRSESAKKSDKGPPRRRHEYPRGLHPRRVGAGTTRVSNSRANTGQTCRMLRQVLSCLVLFYPC
ncbi:hypothetical protein LY76DRAFT_187470 [Colletotrichum caudatum]|nr:hypothetical protein LY76DRAFT_187470 [Colletotrichum caudatum]